MLCSCWPGTATALGTLGFTHPSRPHHDHRRCYVRPARAQEHCGAVPACAAAKSCRAAARHARSKTLLPQVLLAEPLLPLRAAARGAPATHLAWAVERDKVGQQASQPVLVVDVQDVLFGHARQLRHGDMGTGDWKQGQRRGNGAEGGGVQVRVRASGLKTCAPRECLTGRAAPGQRPIKAAARPTMHAWASPRPNALAEHPYPPRPDAPSTGACQINGGNMRCRGRGSRPPACLPASLTCVMASRSMSLAGLKHASAPAASGPTPGRKLRVCRQQPHRRPKQRQQQLCAAGPARAGNARQGRGGAAACVRAHGRQRPRRRQRQQREG